MRFEGDCSAELSGGGTVRYILCCPSESERDMPAASVKSGWLIFKGKYLRGGKVWQLGAACSVTAHSMPHAATQPRLNTVGMTLPLLLTTIWSEANFFFASIQITSVSLRNHFLVIL